ncbi:ribose-phosphate pyrophosphokinase [Methylosinus sporium]|uniref:ribose-phosphate diphosphokinase n=1 Tax=Methylosinus sporium TaxID=428 RepID=A0A549SXQ9_METSR|nr:MULTISPECIES: ribose-phosphate diphosphokinase [Methylosinus]MBU3889370.1 ribose-phosphate diphosphokinase [Methylosinus sp. KRF6]TRL34423.1 ribose-phosphate pyrophosphokinase [Methylosinus sporium]
MTTLAETRPFLKRLFERLDFAPRPIGVQTKHALDHWLTSRRGVAPTFADVVADLRHCGFAFRAVPDARDYEIVIGAKAAAALLGAVADGARLSEAPNRRGAVRLRRLFDEVLRAGEPALVEFTLVAKGRDRAGVELLAAPLALADGTLGAVLGALNIERYETPAPSREPLPESDEQILLFALGSSRALGERIAHEMGCSLAPHEERRFEDGERKVRPLVGVRDKDVYVLSSLEGETGDSGADKLLRLLFFIGALRDAGAARITVVAPYLCYARKDRRTKPLDPVATRYVAQLLESVGADRIATIDAHNVAAFENAFRIESVALDAQALFARYFAHRLGGDPVAVVSPDLGGEKRAELFRQRLETILARPVAKGFMDKHRSMGEITGEIFAGDVAGRAVVILDDLISSGATMARAARACRANGATRIFLAATHALFARDAEAALREAPIEEIVVTDTVAPSEAAALRLRGRLVTLGVETLLAEAIVCLHSGGSIDELLDAGPKGAP